jgi:hypothetical protein
MGRTIESLMLDARSWLRDFPVYFTATSPATSSTQRTIELPHKNVMLAGMSVWATDGTTTWKGVLDDHEVTVAGTEFGYTLDERNGLLRITTQPTTPAFTSSAHLNVEGYYVEWVSDPDLKFHTVNTIAEYGYGNPAWTLESIGDVEADLVALRTAYDVLFSLLVEYSRDIDVSTPQAMHIPATQRFHQVNQLLFGPGGLNEKLKEKENMLGVGLGAAEVGTLRRVSKTTNRLVPVYVVREYDDISRPRRLFTEPDTQGQFNPPQGFHAGRELIEAEGGTLPTEPNP